MYGPEVVAAYFREAVAYLRRYGWTQHVFGVDGGPRCMLGAVLSATTDPRIDAVAMAGKMEEALMRSLGTSPILWNDVSSRTKQQVVAKLIEMAVRLEVDAYAFRLQERRRIGRMDGSTCIWLTHCNKAGFNE